MRVSEKYDSIARLTSLMAGLLILSTLRKRGKMPLLRLAVSSTLIYRGLKDSNFRVLNTVIDRKYTEVRNVNIKVSLTVNRPRHEVYSFWRKIENLPFFMKHLSDVRLIDDKRSRWQLNVPGDLLPVEWESEIVKEELNERIGWQSVDGAIIENAGNIHFKDAGKFGTEVHAVISYRAPGGKVTELLGRLFNPLFEQMIAEDIKNCKRYMETGEIPTIEGQPSGK